MQLLFIDIASNNAVIACVSENAVIAHHAVDSRIGDHELIPLIETLLKEAKWSYDDLTHIACVTGPGGFTSLRVGVTCANVLADQLKIPSEGIHLSDLYAARTENKDALWLHSTKKDSLFIKGDSWNEPTHVTIDELTSKKISSTHFMGELIPEHKTLVADMRLQEESLRGREEILPGFLDGLSYDATLIYPWYGRGW